MASKSSKGGNKQKRSQSIPIKNKTNDKNRTVIKKGNKYTAKEIAGDKTRPVTIDKDKNKTIVSVKKDFIDTIDQFLTKRQNIIFFVSIGLAILFSLLLFDVKVGPGGDDSAYISRAYDFVHGFIYPGYQGPLYPMILSPFILLFGIQLPLLKVLSLFFMVIALIFLYRTFVNRIPAIVLTSALILVSINYFVLYFSSQTYSEAFFMMIQFILFWFFTTRFIDEPSVQNGYKNYILLGFLLLLLSLTKNIAVFSIFAIVGYFMVYKRWKDAGLSLLSFLSFFGLFEIIKRIIWKGQGFQLSGQSSGLMYKDFYNPTLGKEDTMGYVQRFFDNSNLYLSKHLFKFLGLVNENSTDVNPLVTIIIYVLIVVTILIVFRKNKLLFLTGSYTLMMCVLIFISIQKHWDQWRLIIILYPFLLILLFTSFYYIFKRPSLKGLQFIIPVLAIILFFTEFSVTSDHVKVQRAMLVRNLEGDMLYGLTPDWKNYIKMSQWAAAHVPKNQNIGCRKPDISFVYGGRKFFYIGKVPSVTTDSILKLMQEPAIYVGVGIQQIYKTKVFSDPEFIARTVGYVNGSFAFGNEKVSDGNVVGIFRFTVEEFPAWEARLKEAGVYYDLNIIKWIRNIPSISKEYAVFLPDMLLDHLRKNNIKYLLLASLRMNPNENNGSIISTLHRYIYFIQLKYPYLFKEIYKIGDEEPASLYEVSL